MSCVLFCACLLLQTVSVQSDWTGGPGVPGPVPDFGEAFLYSDSVSYSLSGLIVPMSQASGQGVITDWTEHVIEDNSAIDGHGALRPADFDGDGDYDVAGLIDGLNIIRLYRNQLVENGTVTFVPQADLSTSISRYDHAWVGDFDEDGRPDIVVAGDSLFWFRNNGGWSFTKNFLGYWDHRGDTNCLDVGDVDNDADLDIVCGIRPVLLWRNNGNNTFTPESICEGRRYRVMLGDLNNDDYLDILQTDQVYLNPGPSNPGVFPSTPDWGSGFPGGESDGSWIADFDNDNDHDLLVCRQWGTPYAIIWYENDGTGSAYTRHDIITGSDAQRYGDAAIAEDMNLDGRTDVVGGYSRIGYFHQYPLGTFTTVVVDGSYGGSGGCHWVEVENLGYQPGGLKVTKDIMASGTGTFHWWENGMDTSFSGNGWLISSVLDAGSPSTWEWFAWRGNRPAGTELDFYVRSGVSPQACTTGAWQGPFSATTGVEFDTVDLGPYTVAGDRYFQYQVFLAGTNSGSPFVAPVVYDVSVSHVVPAHDVATTAILSPTGTVSPGQVVTPRAVVRNLGVGVETFPVTFRIGNSYDTTVTGVTLGGGQVDTVYFTPWTATPSGTHQTRAFTSLAVDDDRSNDTVVGQVVVSQSSHDVGATAVLVPVGLLDSGQVVIPTAVVHNFGNSPEAFPVTFRIGSVYSQTVSGIRLEPGESDTVFFDVWNAGPIGKYAAKAFTHMVIDQNRSNDTVADTTIVYVDRHDVGAVGVYVPARKVLLDDELWPTVAVQNFGGYSESFNLEVMIADEELVPVFQEEEPVTALEIGETRVVTFTAHSWTATPVGSYRVTATTKLIDDAIPANDAFGPEVVLVRDIPPWPGGWFEVESMPSAPSGKPAKRGAWLTNGPDGTILATKGNKTPDFYRFDPIANTWTGLAQVPPGVEGKPPDKGSKAAYDGDNYVYMTKGYNTLGFHRYDIAADTWEQLADVPAGPSSKKVKGGTDLVHVVKGDTGFVYLLKGYRTEFYRYNTATGQWNTLPDAPSVVKNKWDKGSWLVYDGAGALYAHQAKYYDRATNHHNMFRYDLAADSWESVRLKGVPLLGLHRGRIRKKKSKDGGSGAWHDGEIFALKGGNTQQFFKCTPEADSWTELDTVPTLGTTGRRRMVKYGADIVSYGNGVFFALKGNKTREMWRYSLTGVATPPPRRAGAMAGRTGLGESWVLVVPNPLADGYATVRYGLPLSGPAELRVLDVSGRTLRRVAVLAERDGAVSLDLRSLASGTYVVRLAAPGQVLTRRFVLY